jgi:hypothetical protein
MLMVDGTGLPRSIDVDNASPAEASRLAEGHPRPMKCCSGLGGRRDLLFERWTFAERKTHRTHRPKFLRLSKQPLAAGAFAISSFDERVEGGWLRNRHDGFEC